MRRQLFLCAATIVVCCVSVLPAPSFSARHAQYSAPAESRSYLGFDRNTYPGDAAIPTLRKSFSFTGYWLNTPPGETSNTWRGKREILNSNGFGFLLLFNGRLYKDLKTVAVARNIGARDAA